MYKSELLDMVLILPLTDCWAGPDFFLTPTVDSCSQSVTVMHRLTRPLDLTAFGL